MRRASHAPSICQMAARRPLPPLVAILWRRYATRVLDATIAEV